MVCRECGKFFYEDVAECDECGAKQVAPDGKIAVTYRNNQVVFVDPPVLRDVVPISGEVKKKKIMDDKTFDRVFASFLVTTICLVFFFVMYPNMHVSFDKIQYRDSIEEFDSLEWTSGEFIIDKETYILGDNYSLFLSKGWKYDSEEYPFLGEYFLDTNEKYPSYISLKKDNNYFDALFINKQKTTKDFDKCQIWGIIINNIDSDKELLFTLPGGIKNGSTLDDINNAYGKTYNTIRFNDYKSSLLEYKGDNIYLKLTVFDDSGLKKVEFYKE